MSKQRNNLNSKHSKIEKQFYSEKNFKLLEDVILDMINKDNFNGNHKNSIFNGMEKVFKETNLPNNMSRDDRKDVLTLLNKRVLAHIVSQINKKPIQEKKSFLPAPESTFGNSLNYHQFNKVENTQNNISQYPQQLNENRELKTFYSREFSKPLTNPQLYPNQKLENFPEPEHINSSTNNTNIMFKKIEQERLNENSSKIPKPIEFTLPENTSDNINPENKFKELMKKREIDDSELKNKIPNPEKKNIDSIKKENIESFPYNNSFIQENSSQSEPQYNSFFDGLDENLLNTEEIVDIPLQKNENKKIIQQSDSLKYNEPFKLPEPIYQSIIPTSSQEIFTENLNNEKELKTFYLTISSKYRNSNIDLEPTNFTTSLINNNKNNNTEKINNEIIFEYNNKKIDDTNIIDNKEIVSVECLDVVVPKLDNILNEPYLWLCVNEWKTSNFGIGVPENAFARLKPLPSSDLPFITMRSHILEMQHPDELKEKLTLKLLTSDGEQISIQDRTEIKTIKNNIIEIEENHNIEKGDLLYIHSLYENEVTGFYPNVYIHSIKINNKEDNSTLSLRLFVDKDANNPSNKIGIFADDKDKISILANKYLSIGDKLFLEYTKSKKITGIFEILDVKNDIITIKFPQQSRSFIPKKITRIGFIKKKNEGYTSNNKKDINYKGGVLVKKVEKNKIYIEGYYNDTDNKYFLLNRKNQVNYIFRFTYIN
jgi:hypothetical protein